MRRFVQTASLHGASRASNRAKRELAVCVLATAGVCGLCGCFKNGGDRIVGAPLYTLFVDDAQIADVNHDGARDAPTARSEAQAAPVMVASPGQPR